MKLAFVMAAIFGSISSFAQTADELLDKYIVAIGGKEAWKNVNSLITTGSMQVQGTDVTVVTSVLQGKGARQDIMVMGMNGYNIITPAGGWAFMPWTGQTEPMAASEVEVKQGADQYDMQSNLVNYKSLGSTLEYLGKEDLDGKPTHKLKMTQQSGKQETFYLDAGTYYVVRSVTRRSVNGQEDVRTTSFSNYQKQEGGIVMPLSIGLELGQGMTADLFISKVEVNKPVDESIFKPTN